MKTLSSIMTFGLLCLSLFSNLNSAHASQPQPLRVLQCATDAAYLEEYTIAVYEGGRAALRLESGFKMTGKVIQIPGATVYSFSNLITYHSENTAQINGPESSAEAWNKVSTAIEVALDGVDYIDSKTSFAFTMLTGEGPSSLTTQKVTRVRNPLDFKGVFAGKWSGPAELRTQTLICR